MGILNATPDSFSDGGRFYQRDAGLAQAEKMLALLEQRVRNWDQIAWFVDPVAYASIRCHIGLTSQHPLPLLVARPKCH